VTGVDAPERVKLVIDLQEGRLAAGSVSRSLSGPTPTPNQVLATYLSLVYTLRHAEPGTPLTLRTGDLDVLAQVLRLSEGDVERRLTELMADPAGEISLRKRLLRGRVVVPVAGILVAVTAVGALLLVVDRERGDQPATSPAGPVADEEPHIDSTVMQVPGPDGSSHPVTTGDGVRPQDVGPGGVGLAPAQVVERGPDGGAVQSERPPADDASTTTTTS
jgi:hypothetical protein